MTSKRHVISLIFVIKWISCLTLKVYLNLLVYDGNIFESSSNVFGNLQVSGNLWKVLETCDLQTIFGESFRKWSGIFGKWSKTLLLVCLFSKQSNTRLLLDMEYLLLSSTLHLTYLVCSVVRYRVEQSKIYSYQHAPKYYPPYITPDTIHSDVVDTLVLHL